MKCPNCKRIIPPGQRQCIYCGTPLWSSDKPRNYEPPKTTNWMPIATFVVSVVLVLALLVFNPFKKFSNEGSSHSSSGSQSSRNSSGSSKSNGSGKTGGNASGGGSNAKTPDDAIEFDGNYYYVYTGLNLSSRAAAEKFCENRGGHLAVITSDELNDRLYDLCWESGVETAIFGYSDEKIEGNWEWVTEKQPGYTNWGKTEPNADADGEDCAIFSTSEANGKWNDSQFGHETTDFICQWNDNGITDDPILVSIPDDAVTFEGHHYYLFDNGKSSWSEAQNYCKWRGGDLAVINSGDENAFLFNYMLSCGYDQAFIGYSDEESEGYWYWVSGKTSNYTDWGINDEGDVEPNSDSRWENFCQLDNNMVVGTWNDSKFGNNTTAYICEWE